MDKKRILIVNKFLYTRGGDCIVAFADAELLRNAGHEVEFWGMDYPKNQPDLPLADTFASEVDFSGGPLAKLRAFERLFGLGDIRKSFKEVLERFRPTTVFFHNIHSYLSPVIVGMAKDFGARTIWTQHDYKLVCPAYNACDPSGRVCTDCITNHKAVISKRCLKDSLIQSVTAYAEARYWNPSRLARMTDAFICPCETMARNIIKGGFPTEKAVLVPHFITPVRDKYIAELSHSTHRIERRIITAGRLEPVKGTVRMLGELTTLEDDFNIYIFGRGLEEEQINHMAAKDPRIHFGGWVDPNRLSEEMSSASLAIFPTLVLENSTTSVIEALVAGTPVIVSNVGMLPEMIRPGWGLTYDPFTPGSLKEAIQKAFATKWDNHAISAQARDLYSAERHLSILSTLL